MKIYKILTFMLLAGLTSCYKEVPFRGLDDKPALFFQCMPGAQDTTVLWLRATFPVNQDVTVPEIVNPIVSLKVNGNEADVRPNAGISSAFPADAFFTTVALVPGDRLDFRAVADGYEPITSSTVIPERFSDISVEVSLVPSPNPEYYTAYLGRGASQGMSKEVVEFEVTFQDDPDKSDYYMAEVTEYAYYQHSDGRLSSYVSPVAYILPTTRTDFAIEPDPVNDIILVEHAAPWNTINDFFGDAKLVCVFDDSGFNGLKHTMEILVNSVMYNSASELKYRLKLYHVSEEYYKYAKAWKIAEDSDYTSFPSTSPFMAYNNIEGGNGIFAGVQVYDSGVITPVPLQ